MNKEQDRQKAAAAESAAAQVSAGMVVGLGSGSTASLAVAALGRRVREGLRISGIPTSERTADQARELGIPLTSFAETRAIDLTIDGADEVEESNWNLIKGHGGALLREKIVARASRRLIIVVDSDKMVTHLGRGAVPVEVVQFGWQDTARRLPELRGEAVLRQKPDGSPFLSDGGHYILDCDFGAIGDPARLANELDHVVGVVEHGLFIGCTTEVHIGEPAGVRVLKAEHR
jgi:ribose 5-phosphate isomerase A